MVGLQRSGCLAAICEDGEGTVLLVAQGAREGGGGTASEAGGLRVVAVTHALLRASRNGPVREQPVRLPSGGA